MFTNHISASFISFKAKKTLLVPTPRLRAGLFNKITPPEGASKEQLRVCSTSQVSFQASSGLASLRNAIITYHA
jgi:hypothetical protein